MHRELACRPGNLLPLGDTLHLLLCHGDAISDAHQSLRPLVVGFLHPAPSHLAMAQHRHWHSWRILTAKSVLPIGVKCLRRYQFTENLALIREILGDSEVAMRRSELQGSSVALRLRGWVGVRFHKSLDKIKITVAARKVQRREASSIALGCWCGPGEEFKGVGGVPCSAHEVQPISESVLVRGILISGQLPRPLALRMISHYCTILADVRLSLWQCPAAVHGDEDTGVEFACRAAIALLSREHDATGWQACIH
mmetsp:Transcript_19506/g.48801  ORF Transcript_19506/g.48801 Transcript_19506/m.48801 type:complete len:254 (-) Transcript_19506:2580-3341(-)